MPLKHRLARLEAAVSARKRAAEELIDPEETWRVLQELHADPARLGLLRAVWDAESETLPPGVDRDMWVKERWARLEAYGPPAPEGAAVVLQYQLERLEHGMHGYLVFDWHLATKEDVLGRLRALRADPTALHLLEAILRLIPRLAVDFTKVHLIHEGAELLARLKAHQASKGAAA